MAELPAADPIKKELEDLLAAAKERAAAEQQVATEFDTGLEDPEYELQATLKKIGAQFDAQLQEAQQDWEVSRETVSHELEQEEGSIRTQQEAAQRDIEQELGKESERADKEKADASWMVSSVLDDNSHESPRYQYETFK